jgi:hypothetical protein
LVLVVSFYVIAKQEVFCYGSPAIAMLGRPPWRSIEARSMSV